MKYKKLVVWCLVTEQEHPLLTDEEKKIKSLMPLVQAVLPGVKHYSNIGFNQVMMQCVMPVLKKSFPELATLSADEIAREPDAEVEVAEFFPSKGYEWQYSGDWQLEFEKRLAA